MNTTIHIFNTWLLALLLFPFISCGFSILTIYETTAFDMVPHLFVFGIIFSLPALLLCFLGMRLLFSVQAGYDTRFFLWLVVIVLSIFAGALVMGLLLFNLRIVFDLLPFVIAAAAAGLTSAMLRFRQFIYFIHKKTREYENDLV